MRFPAAPGATVVTVTDLATNLIVAVTAGATVPDVNDAQTIHYDTADIIGLNLETVGQKQLAIHFTPAAGAPEQALLTVLPADAILALYDGRVWINVSDGVAGAVFGVNGTRGNPVDNLAHARTLADAFGSKHYMIDASAFGPLVVNTDHLLWTFEGITSNLFGGSTAITIDAAADVSGSVFKRARVTGDFVGSTQAVVVFEDSTGSILSNIFGLVLRGDCTLDAAIGLAAGGGGLVQLGGTVRRTPFTGGPNINVPAGIKVCLDHIVGGRIGITVPGDGAEIVLGFDVPGDVEIDGGAFASATVDITNPKSLTRFNNPPATITITPGKLLEGLFLLIDQRQYVQDGPNQLQIKCRRSSFANEVDRAAAVPDDVGPFIEGQHALAIQTQYIESVVGANPGEPKQFKVRTL